MSAAPKLTRWTDKYAFDKSDPATRMFVACSNWMDRAEAAEAALRKIVSVHHPKGSHAEIMAQIASAALAKVDE